MPVWCLRFGIVQSADESQSNSTKTYTDSLLALGQSSGLHKVGVARADILHRALNALNDRKLQGLHNQMQFTYRNPTRSTDPTKTLPSAKSVIVGALSYSSKTPEKEPGDKYSARIARYVWSDYYEQLRKSLRQVAGQLEADGYRGVVLADDNSIVDREVAYQAGLGWFGKNSNLLISGAGSYFVLGCIITDAVLTPAVAPVADGCGSCRRCFDNCPTDAIVAPGMIDANKCLAWLIQKPGVFDKRFRVALGDRLYGCDDCQEVCPPTVRHDKNFTLGESELTVGRPKAWVSVVKILTANDETLLADYGVWYIADREPRWLRRNALVILGNIGENSDEVVVDLLKNYLMHADPMLRAHAVWATARLGLNHLLPRSDVDELVKAELQELPSVR